MTKAEKEELLKFLSVVRLRISPLVTLEGGFDKAEGGAATAAFDALYKLSKALMESEEKP